MVALKELIRKYSPIINNISLRDLCEWNPEHDFILENNNQKHLSESKYQKRSLKNLPYFKQKVDKALKYFNSP